MAESMQITRRIKCSFKGCERFFATEKEIIKHKKYTPEHDYCARCDEDFDDEESHLIHKIQSSKHIACPICGADFKSDGGRDIHLRQIHQGEQKISCAGCQATFGRASALMAHIEGGNCEGITIDHYRAQRIQKLVTKTALEERLGRKTLPPPDGGAAASTAESVDGGVRLNILDDSQFPILEKGKGKSTESTDSFDDDDLNDAASEVSGVARSIKHWPTVVTDNKVKAKPAEKDLMGFSKLAIADNNADGDVLPKDKKEEDMGQSEWGERPPESDEPVRKKMPQHFVIYDTDRYYNKTLGVYVCPCDRVFKTSEAVNDHLNSDAHGPRLFYCPVCHRPFKSTVALVAHVESVTTRCNIRQLSSLGAKMDDISGGVITAGEYHEDGSVTFQAGAKQELKPIDLNKIAW